MNIPSLIKDLAVALNEAGFEAYLVGGSLRDLLLKREPKDWDIATDAKPEEIQRLFPDSIYENNFGTVAIKTDSNDPSLKIIEITTFRLEGEYSDNRHPDDVKFADNVEADLARRDFTVNALAWPISKKSFAFKDLVDPFSGQVDLKQKIIKAVGDPVKRFEEDALRLLRAVRLAIELNFDIDPDTLSALKSKSNLLKNIAPERIRDELIKIIKSPQALDGILLLKSAGLLTFIIPELLEGDGCTQNKHHIYDVFEHGIRSLDYAARQNYSLVVRLAALLHDVGKPRTKKEINGEATFYAHEIVGAKMAKKILQNLHFSNEVIQDVRHLIRYHMFNYNVGEVSPAGVRRLLAKVGLEYIDDLIRVRESDRIGSGVPKAKPYKLRHLLFMIDKVRRDPISPKALKLNGQELMEFLGIEPSPRVGMILHALLDEVISDPKVNTKDYLEAKAKELNQLSDAELSHLMAISKANQAKLEEAVEQDIKDRYYVK